MLNCVENGRRDRAAQREVRLELELFRIVEIASVQRFVEIVDQSAAFGNVKIQKLGLGKTANAAQLNVKSGKIVENRACLFHGRLDRDVEATWREKRDMSGGPVVARKGFAHLLKERAEGLRNVSN